MFKVLEKETKAVYTVYDVKYDKNGYPHFLIYDTEKSWLVKSAKHFYGAQEMQFKLSPIND